MFGLFKPKMAPEGPVEIEMGVEIERSAADVFAMVDFGDPRHYKNEVGTITRTGESTFDMALDMLPGMSFPITELEAVDGHTYIFQSVIPAEVGGRLHKTVESYEIEPMGDDRCNVTARTLAYFKPMKLKHYEDEVATMAIACNNALLKLKIHAEQGVEMIREIEMQQVA